MRKLANTLALLALLAGLGHAPALSAAACANAGTGNWSAAGTWAAPCNVAGGPTAADTVTIINGTTVTVNNAGMAANSVTIATGNANTTLTFAAGSSLAVTNNVIIDQPTSNNRTKTITALTGTLTVGGNVTLTGGTTASRGALLSVSSGLITINGGLIINASVATSSTASITAAGGRITVNGAAGVTNGDVVSVGAGTFSVTNAAATFNNTSATNVASTTVSTGTLSVTGNLTNAAGETMTVSSTGDITVAGTLTNDGAITLTTTGIVNANGDFTNSATGVFTNTAAGNLNIGGNATMSGTFNGGTGTVTFNGGAAQILGGTAATTFNDLTISTSGASNVSIACATPSPTVNATLALTSGDIITAGTSPGCSTACGAQVPIIVAAAGTITGGSGTSYVQGALRKLFSAGATLNFRAVAGQDEFPVGDASNYAPVEIRAGTTSTAGNVTACVTPTEHPQVTTPPVASGGIDTAKSVNRYWSLTTSTINTTAVLVNAIFKFNGAFVSSGGDVDNIATTGNFIVEDWNGTSWGPTTLVAAGASSTQASSIDLTGATNEFAIGEALSGITSVPGLYNAFETSTPAGILGMIQTKVAGTAFSLDIVHINATKTGVLAGAITVEVRLLDSSGGGAPDVNGCNAAWPLIQALPNFAIPASGRGTIPAVTEANSYPSVRFQIRSPAGGPYTQTGCSTDLFAIRPQSLTITSHDATWATSGTGRALANISASGGNVHKASTSGTPLPFTLRATPVPASATLYNGTPTTVAGFPSCTALGALCTNPGTLSYTAGSWTAAGSGVRENATATYSEAGAFNLQLEDTSYASVDAVDGSSAATRTVPAASVQIGRFVPDHFGAAKNTPKFNTFCGGTSGFTYIGQPFWYATVPSVTLTAMNAAGGTTVNYAASSLFHLTTGMISQTYNNNSVGPSLDTSAIGSLALTNNNDGTATIGLNTGTILYTRNTTTPANEFTNANISLSITAADTSELPANAGATIPTSPTPVVFNGTGSGIAFDSPVFRYGILKLDSAYGSELLPTRIPVRAMYRSSGGFIPNPDDSCTQLATANVAIGNYISPLASLTNCGFAPAAAPYTEPCKGTYLASTTLSGGGATLVMSSAGVTGSADIALNLTGTTTDVSCNTTHPASTGAGLAWLQGLWGGSTACPSTLYDRDPNARTTFGSPRSPFIYLREMY